MGEWSIRGIRVEQDRVDQGLSEEGNRTSLQFWDYQGGTSYRRGNVLIIPVPLGAREWPDKVLRAVSALDIFEACRFWESARKSATAVFSSQYF